MHDISLQQNSSIATHHFKVGMSDRLIKNKISFLGFCAGKPFRNLLKLAKIGKDVEIRIQ